MRIICFILAVSLYNICSASEEDSSSPDNWKSIQLQVAAITNLDFQFSRSVVIFSRESSSLYKPKHLLIDGDSNKEIVDSKTTHIHGNLDADVYLDDHSELIVGENVSSDTTVYVNGLSNIFIGGNFNGTLIAKSSYLLHIAGDHHGKISTGHPSTKVIVHGDFKGTFSPLEGSGSLASIQVYGFTSRETIESILSHKYTQISAVFHYSNIAPGIYETESKSRSFYTIVNQKK